MNIKCLIQNIKNETTIDSSVIEVEQILEAGRKIPIVLLGNFVIGSITFTLLWNDSPIYVFICMVALFTVSIMLRVVLLRYYQNVNSITLKHWQLYFVGASFFSGLIWGGLGIMFEVYTHQLYGFQAFIFGGMAAGAVVTNSSIRFNYSAYIVAMLVPSIIYYFLHNSPDHIWMAVMYFLFMVIMIGMSFNFGQIQFDKLVLLIKAKKANDELLLAQIKLKSLTQNMSKAQSIAHLGDWEWNIEDNSIYWSDEIYRIFGLKPKAFAATYDAFINTVHPDDRENLQKAVEKTLLDNIPYALKHRIILPDGSIRIVLEKGEVYKNNDGTNQRMVGTIQDITEQERHRNELQKMSAVIEQIDDIVMVSNRIGIIEYVNDAFVNHTGYTREEVYGKKANILRSGEHDELFYKNIWETILSGKVYRNRITNQKKNGELYYEQKTITPIKNEKNIIIGFASSGQDITSNIHLEQELERMARTDNLTGIYNRHSFEEIYEKETERSTRYQNPLSLIMLDIDYFKRINDTYGHDIGDKVLKQLAMTVTMVIRKSDIFARVGGEEFLILCPETDAQQAKQLANKIRQEIEATNFEEAGKVTSSFGVTQYKMDEKKELFLKRADDALYIAKEHGRNRVEWQ